MTTLAGKVAIINKAGSARPRMRRMIRTCVGWRRVRESYPIE